MFISCLGCRCGRVKKGGKCRKYVSRNRCKCIVSPMKSCSLKCKCAGHCGETMCKRRVKKISNKQKKQRPRAKHVLQTCKEKIPKCMPQGQEKNPPNFLELCILCAIIHFVKFGSMNSSNYENNMYAFYTSIIDVLQSHGICLPISKLSEDVVTTKLKSMAKNFRK